MNPSLILQYLHDACEDSIPSRFWKFRSLQQHKRIVMSSNVVASFPAPKALRLASEFPTSYVHSSYYPWTPHLQDPWSKYISRNLLALSTFGFSIANFCLSLRLHPSDKCFQISGYNMWSPEIVYFLVRLQRNMYLHPVSFDQYGELFENLPINYLHHHSSNLQYVSLTSSKILSPLLVTSMYFSGNGYPSSRHQQFTWEFHVMTVREVDEDPYDFPRRVCYLGLRWIFSYPDLLNKFYFAIWI